jgi:hypothetical protein
MLKKIRKAFELLETIDNRLSSLQQEQRKLKRKIIIEKKHGRPVAIWGVRFVKGNDGVYIYDEDDHQVAAIICEASAIYFEDPIGGK